MPGNRTAKALEVNPSLLAFRPRQVVLLSKPQIMKLDNNTRTLALKPEQKALLYISIAQFLQRSGFSKTVKKFLSEANIEKDDLGNSSYDLEEMFCKFLDMCNDVSKNPESHKVKDGEVDDTSVVDGKKSSDKASKSKIVGDVIDNAVPIDKKSEAKKRSKKDKDTLDLEQTGAEFLEETVIGAYDESKEEKKKKKKNKKSSDPVIAEEKGNKNDSKKEEIESPGEMEKENKSSKKRKREAAGDSVQPACVNAVEEPKKKKEKSKRQKTEVSEELKVEGGLTELKSATKSEDGNNQESQKTSTELVNGLSNGSLEKSGEKSSIKKTAKERNGSAEPKIVKHFQRVKVDEVVFSDERLKNNSYWAKDGADIGYGAKAQEILEQVRGRDFRHEKTKKKRGTYRGGQISLQSHSVKFNYSDDE